MKTVCCNLNSCLTPRPWHPDLPWGGDGWLDYSPQAPPAIWLIQRQLALEIAGDLLPLLSPEERGRLYRLRRQEDRDCLLLGRGVLRLLLARPLGVVPAAVRFVQTPHGKPFLDPTCTASSLQFNVAHSGDLILLGFHPRRPVGVDLEMYGADMEWQPIARQFFPRMISDGIAALTQAEQLPAFYRQWCRLEAALKARGTGFATDSHAACRPEPPGTVSAGSHDLLLPPNYAGSAAVI